MKKRLLLVSSMMVLVLGLLFGGCAGGAVPTKTVTVTPGGSAAPESEPTVIKAVTWLPVDFAASIFAGKYAERVEERSNGQLVIDIVGDGDVISTEEQIFAVKEGRIDMIFSCGDDISQGSPIGFAMGLTDMKPWEEREAGIWDFYRETFARDTNTYWLGNIMSPQWWSIYTNVRAEHPQDLEGLKIRAGATHFGSLEAIGAEPVSTPMMEIYTAMERGMVDGFVFPPCCWTQFSWQETTEYWVGPRLLRGQNSCPMINLDVWNSLSEEQQNLLTDTVIDMEEDMHALHWWIWTGEEYGEEAILNAGVEHIEWTEEENEWIQETWREALWDYVEKQVNPEDFDRFEELVGHQ